ncbi:MAG: hypothetical protein RR348_03615 [Clostridia bacterium]
MENENKMTAPSNDILNDEILDMFDGKDEERTKQISNEQLKEMNKKLPKWSLEPPLKYIK